MSTILCVECGEPNAEYDLLCKYCQSRLPDLMSEDSTDHGAAQQAEDDALIGQTFSGYRMESCLGRGSMGAVYRALDLQTGRRVALKLLAAPLAAEPSCRARFRREARAAAALDHPSVGKVHAIEEHDGRPFIVMPLYEGQTLEQRMRHGPVPVAEAVGILSRMASGLGAAHAAGVVHRDLKPGNVMLLSPDGVKLLDFGLAKLVQDLQSTGTALTRTGQVIGTLAYMSPEQVRAEPMDQRTDLWSAGVIAYEMFTGHRPFRGPTAAALVDKILMEDAVPVRELRPEVPAALERLLQGLLRKPLGQRIGSAQAILDILEQQRFPEPSQL